MAITTPGFGAKPKPSSGTFDTPDFAFPQTVDKTAQSRYDASLRSGDYLTALRAAIQLCIAQNLVNPETYQQAIARFDSLANLAEPHNRAVAACAYTLEAKLYTDIYLSNSWNFDERVLPAGEVPENVLAWNRALFLDKVQHLIAKAGSATGLSHCPEALAEDVPLSSIAPLLKGYEAAEKAGLTVADFVAVKSADLLRYFSGRDTNIIPFESAAAVESSPRALALKLLDAAESRHLGAAPTQAGAWLALYALDYQPDPASAAYAKRLKECLDRYGNSPYGAEFVVKGADAMNLEGADSDIEKKTTLAKMRYDMLTGYLKQFPDAPRIGDVQNAINTLLASEVTVNYNSQLLPGRKQKLNVTGSNLTSFYLLVYKVNGQNIDSRVKYSQLGTIGKLVATVPVNPGGEKPFYFNTEVEIPALQPGLYVFVPSESPSLAGLFSKEKNDGCSPSLVSDILLFSTSDRVSGRTLYVASAENLEPLPGTQVKVYQMKNGKRIGEPKIHTADAQGAVQIPEGDYDCVAEGNGKHAGSIATSRLWKIYRGSPSGESLRAAALTNLALYRPGDKVDFALVVYSRFKKQIKTVADKDLQVVLHDANWQAVDTLKLVTDSYGRCNAAFTLPADGLLGNWGIAIHAGEKNSQIGTEYFEVAEYKAPNFFVTLKEGQLPADTTRALFRGEAMTYSGMPVAGAKVAYTVRTAPIWWRSYSSASGEYSGETVTDSKGGFVIDLPLAGLNDTPYQHSLFSVTATVTDGAGETEESAPLRFSLGKSLQIVTDLPALHEVESNGSSFNVTVRDITGAPVRETVHYLISRDGATVAQGSFESPEFRPDLTSLPSGRYAFKFSLQDPATAKGEALVTDSVVLWRRDDRRPPVTSPLWVPQRDITVPTGTRSVKLRVGSSYPDSHILALVCTDTDPVETRWLTVSDGFATLPLAAPAADARTFVKLLGCHDLETGYAEVTVTPQVQREQLKISQETFRASIEPGTEQSWSFRFSFAGKPCAAIPVMAVMSDKSLNSITPFSWHFNPASSINYSAVSQLDHSSVYSMRNYVWIPSGRLVKVPDFSMPMWNLYGQQLYSVMHVRDEVKLFMTAARSAGPMVSNDMAYQESAEMDNGAMKKEAAVDMVGETEAAAGGAIPDDTSFRPAEFPSAFFMPDLVTDADGIATLRFTAPQFVGTWQLQLMGYREEDAMLKSATLTLDAMASKRVMAQLNAPRFARTSDHLSVSATLYNNSADTLPLGGVIEFLDPVSGRVLASHTLPAEEETLPSGQRVVSAMLDVPTDINALQIRVYARAEKDGNSYSDGEQTVIPVLPSSQPVTESVPFYLPANDGQLPADFEIQLPKFSEGDRLTLTYCDNPVWECVTALPAMLEPQSVNILARTYALYGNAVSASLFSRYPQLMKGIEALNADSALVSPLQRDPELKTVLLRNTPWVNNAASETLRMQSLLKFADTAHAEAVVNGMMKDIADSQRSDGGWSWCPDMESSFYMTREVLAALAALADMDCLPQGGREAAEMGFRFADKEFVRQWNLSKKKNLPLTSLLHYLYARSCFGGIKGDASFAPLEAAAVRKIKADWRDFDIYDKATAAMLLSRRGEAREALVILESIRQFASVSPERGMWFAGKDAGSDLLTTARVLEAYAELLPGNEAINRLRQWMVMSKQTQDWGTQRRSAEAIHALLTTGTDWTAGQGEQREALGCRISEKCGEIAQEPTRSTGVPHFSEMRNNPVITLNAKPLRAVADQFGSFTIDLSPAEASGALLRIERCNAAPAWGGVISRRIAPITDIKAAEIPQLSITKQVVTVEGNGLEVGDKVRITLTIVCDRDLDYVAVTDPRAACLEPVEQLSEYTVSDGVWMYREVRDTQTNLFIPRLRKGTHVISYECVVDRAGAYALGASTAQSQYAPTITAHTAGSSLSVVKSEE